MTPHELVPGASCYDVNVRVVADGQTVLMGEAAVRLDLRDGRVTGVHTGFGASRRYFEAEHVITTMPVRSLARAGVMRIELERLERLLPHLARVLHPLALAHGERRAPERARQRDVPLGVARLDAHRLTSVRLGGAVERPLLLPRGELPGVHAVAGRLPLRLVVVRVDRDGRLVVAQRGGPVVCGVLTVSELDVLGGGALRARGTGDEERRSHGQRTKGRAHGHRDSGAGVGRATGTRPDVHARPAFLSTPLGAECSHAA